MMVTVLERHSNRVNEKASPHYKLKKLVGGKIGENKVHS